LAAVTDTAGTLHVIWQVSGPGVYELHYQKRWTNLAPWPRDTLLEVQSASFQAPSLALDRDGGIHLAYEGSGSTAGQIRYRRWRPGHGWDFRSTDLTDGIDGTFEQPSVLPASNDNVVVLFSAFRGSAARFMLRRRFSPNTRLDVAGARTATPTMSVAMAPNPLRRGGSLELTALGPLREPWIDVFDVAGRRLASVELHGSGDRWRGQLRASETRDWPGGIYFMRPRSSPGPGRQWVMLR
jgi:hypothetical protein